MVFLDCIGDHPPPLPQILVGVPFKARVGVGICRLGVLVSLLNRFYMFTPYCGWDCRFEFVYFLGTPPNIENNVPAQYGCVSS